MNFFIGIYAAFRAKVVLFILASNLKIFRTFSNHLTMKIFLFKTLIPLLASQLADGRPYESKNTYIFLKLSWRLGKYSLFIS